MLKLQKLYKEEDLELVLREISTYNDIVSYDEILDLKSSLCDSDFIFHGGDCAESFLEASDEYLESQIKVFHEYKRSSKSISILRGAGQFFKPRSNLYQGEILNYFGDGINGISIHDRNPDPNRLKVAYDVSFRKMNYLRNNEDNIFISHEALFIPYEECFLRKSVDGKLYSSSAHMLWLGYRSMHLESEQLAFLSKISNPIALKIGPDTDLDKLLKIIDILNPLEEKGKIILIIRFGKKSVKDILPRFQRFLYSMNNPIILIDPLHGNNIQEEFGKARYMDDIISECEILKEYLDITCGVSLEFTPYEDIESCYTNDLVVDQKSLCDPRVCKSQVAKIMQHLFLSNKITN